MRRLPSPALRRPDTGASPGPARPPQRLAPRREPPLRTAAALEQPVLLADRGRTDPVPFGSVSRRHPALGGALPVPPLRPRGRGERSGNRSIVQSLICWASLAAR